MAHTTLAEIKDLVKELASIIDAPDSVLPTFGNSNIDSRPYIEIQDGILFYLVKERGIEVLRYIAKDVDDLLYNVFKDVTFMMASKYELANRIKGQDFRRLLFSKQESLLNILNEAWKIRDEERHQEILSRHPFDDHSSERASYYKILSEEGKPHDDAWESACKKYPLPAKM